jgi:ABC-2 type transport system ATP-binding protein
MHAISVEQLTKRFGTVTAVDGLSFEVESGTVTGFLGPNGAGKTTTLRILLGLVRPDGGTALFDGKRCTDLTHPVRQVGAVLEAASFHPGRTARDHLRILALMGGLEPERVEEVLDVVELTGDADRRVGGFSLGMRQRLGLAAALLGDPPVLVLDEPANGLDPAGIRWLRQLLRIHAEAGGTVLVSSHQLAELSLSADRVVILQKGRFVAQGSIDELAGHATVVVKTPHTHALVTALRAQGIEAGVVEHDTVRAATSNTDAVGRAIAQAAIPVYEMRLDRTDLESIFLDITQPEPTGRTHP